MATIMMSDNPNITHQNPISFKLKHFHGVKVSRPFTQRTHIDGKKRSHHSVNDENQVRNYQQHKSLLFPKKIPMKQTDLNQERGNQGQRESISEKLYQKNLEYNRLSDKYHNLEGRYNQLIEQSRTSNNNLTLVKGSCMYSSCSALSALSGTRRLGMRVSSEECSSTNELKNKLFTLKDKLDKLNCKSVAQLANGKSILQFKEFQKNEEVQSRLIEDE